MSKELGISVQTGDWYDLMFQGDKHPDEAFAFIKSCGFDAMDYNMEHTLMPQEIVDGTLNTFYDATIEELLERYRPVKEALERNGVSFGQAHAPYPCYVEGADKVNKYMIQVLEKECAILQYLGCPALVVHPFFCEDWEKEKEINLAMYRQLIPAAKKYGIKICLENTFTFRNSHAVVSACGEAAEVCWYLDTLNAEAGADVFGFCLDVGHANVSGRNLRREIKMLGDRLTILHIHDNDGQGDQHLIPYTQKQYRVNTTDWEGFLAGLRDIGYKGTLNFETFAGLYEVPQELFPSFLRLIADIGKYFKKRIEE